MHFDTQSEIETRQMVVHANLVIACERISVAEAEIAFSNLTQTERTHKRAVLRTLNEELEALVAETGELMQLKAAAYERACASRLNRAGSHELDRGGK